MHYTSGPGGPLAAAITNPGGPIMALGLWGEQFMGEGGQLWLDRSI